MNLCVEYTIKTSVDLLSPTLSLLKKNKKKKEQKLSVTQKKVSFSTSLTQSVGLANSKTINTELYSDIRPSVLFYLIVSGI